jgi:hypothetical protein
MRNASGKPPHGERASVPRNDDRFIGLFGYVPSFEPFQRLQSFGENNREGLDDGTLVHEDWHGQGAPLSTATRGGILARSRRAGTGLAWRPVSALL